MPIDHLMPQGEEYTLDLPQSVQPTIFSHAELEGIDPQGHTIAVTNYYVMRDGHPCIPIVGEFHASRFPRQYWHEELRKIRAGGVIIVATYIFWIHIEEEEGLFDWTGDRDIRAFVEACQEEGLQVLLRIGPFAHGECRNGGLPDWLYGRGIAVRSNDQRYLFYVRRFFAEIAQQVSGLLFKDGGPVIGIQIENEYMHAGAPWEVTFRQGEEWVPAGSDGVEHMQVLKRLAMEEGLQAPIYSCTAWGGAAVPEHGFFPMQSAYAFTPWVLDPQFRQGPTREFLFRDRHEQQPPEEEAAYDVTRYPYAYCELGTGTQITYQHRPIIPAECVQALAVVALGSGTNLLGYYMYHGGSNPAGKHAYFNEFTVPRISYDFQAPIREYGQLNQSYHRLRLLHLFLEEFGEMLAPMTVTLPANSAQRAPENTAMLRYAARSKDGAGFLFLNNYQDHVVTQDLTGIRLCLQLPDETLLLPESWDLTLCKNVSAILPFNISLAEGVLLKYATAQFITTVKTPEQTTCVFFAPLGMRAEFALDRATYRSVEVAGGALREESERGYIAVEPGLHCRVDITALNGSHLQLLVLTQAQAESCWKVQIRGQEFLILSEELVISQENALHLYWRGSQTIDLLTYPLLPDALISSNGSLNGTREGLFTRYSLSVPEQKIALSPQRQDDMTMCIELPTIELDGLHDLFLRIDYVGDVGNAYLDGRLVGDHFANGLPWEIGLKRFLAAETGRELIIRISPRQANADGTAQVSVRSVSIVPEYHAALLFETGKRL